jgi:hypothetical protein
VPHGILGWEVRVVDVRVFRSGEEDEFREWMRRRRGYVINTDSSYSDRDSTRIHRATCFTLEPGFGGGRRQTDAYIKICSADPKTLNEWARAHLGYGLRSQRCRHCEPTSLGLTE